MLDDKRFLKYLIVFGLVVVAGWTIFDVWFLPTIPDTNLKGLIALIGGAAIFFTIALLLIEAFEAGETGEDEEDSE